MSHTRYALFLTPPQDNDLWAFGCEVIGRNAWTGEFLDGFAPNGHELEAWRKLTSEPRRYGFHATLKAPFRLRADLEAFDLMDAVASFARTLTPFDAGDMGVSHMKANDGRGFVVLKPEGGSKGLHSLADGAVRALDRMRAPLTEEERSRRNLARLNPRQRYYLEAWGYPYVLDEFRPHFTLTNPLEQASSVASALEWEFRLRVASPALRVELGRAVRRTRFGRRFRGASGLPARPGETGEAFLVEGRGRRFHRLRSGPTVLHARPCLE